VREESAGLPPRAVVVRDVAAGQERSLLENGNSSKTFSGENLNPIEEALGVHVGLSDDFGSSRKTCAAAEGRTAHRREPRAPPEACPRSARASGLPVRFRWPCACALLALRAKPISDITRARRYRTQSVGARRTESLSELSGTLRARPQPAPAKPVDVHTPLRQSSGCRLALGHARAYRPPRVPRKDRNRLRIGRPR